MGVLPHWTTKSQLFINHMMKDHAADRAMIARNFEPLMNWLRETNRFICGKCVKSYSAKSKVGCRCGNICNTPAIREVTPIIEVNPNVPIFNTPLVPHNTQVNETVPEDQNGPTDPTNDDILDMLKTGVMLNLPTVEFLFKRIRMRWARLYSDNPNPNISTRSIKLVQNAPFL